MSGLAPHQRARMLRGAAPIARTAERLGISERQLRRLELGEHRRGPHHRTKMAYVRVFGADPWPGSAGPQSTGAEDVLAEREAIGQRLRRRRMELGLTQEKVGELGRERFALYMQAVSRKSRGTHVWSILGTQLAPATVSRYERGLTGGRWESALALALALELEDIAIFRLSRREARSLGRMWNAVPPRERGVAPALKS